MTPTPDNTDACADIAPDTAIDGDMTPVLVIAEGGRICHVNQAAVDLLGYTTDELTHRKVSSLVLDAGMERDLLCRWHDGEDIRSEELELLRAGGERVVVLVTAAAPAPGISPWRAHWRLRDITAERDAEERDARLAAIIHDSDDAIITKRMDGVITSWNPAAARLFGYTAEEMIGQPISVIMPPDMEDEFPGIMRRLARGEHIDHYETVRQTKTGRLVDVSVSIAPIRNSAGRIVGASDITRDITERRALDRKQREFLTMVAHDLRSPLTSIKGFAQLMQRREAYSPSAVRAILTQVRLMERLVGDVLEIMRLDEDRLGLTLEEMDLREMARTVVEHVADLRPDVTITLDTPDQPMAGRWDEGRLAQVLDNLLSNAVKYAPGGPIEVALARSDDQAVITVQDHGPGIDPESLPHIFDRFYRGAAERASSRGVGLGLAISRALVEAHGGTIRVDSEAGAGTRFTVTLPWSAEPDAAAR
jgi:PAS domain S-box-containing protein